MTLSLAKTLAPEISPGKPPRLLAEKRTDPHGLWTVAVLVSAIVHLLLGWAVVRLLLVEGKPVEKSQELIRIETVAISPTPQTSPQPLTQPSPNSQPSSTQAQQSTPTPPAQAEAQPQTETPARSEKRGSWRWFRPGARGQAGNEQAIANEPLTDNSSASSNREWRTAQQLSRANAQRRSSTNSESIFNDSVNPGQRQTSATQRRSSSSNAQSIWNDSAIASRSDSGSSGSKARRFAGSGSDSMWDDSPQSQSSPKPWNQQQSGKSGSSSSGSSDSNANAGSSAPPASNSQQSRGVTASLGAPRLTRPDRDVPDKLATPKQNSQQLSVLPLGVRLDGQVVLEVTAVIEPNGKATVFGTKVVSGSLDSQKVEQIAKQLVERWGFEPTYMGGQAVAQEYFIQLSLAPIFN